MDTVKKIFACAALPLVAGCLTAHQPETSRWTLDFQAGADAVAGSSKYGVARVSQVVVRAPYGSEEMVVLRADGTVALDAYNIYAAAPAQLLRGCVYDALAASGLFESVVNANSAVTSAVSVEVLVTRLALDCRSGGAASRKAHAEIVLRIVDSRGILLKTLPAVGEADAADANFGQSLSRAVSAALMKALADAK